MSPGGVLLSPRMLYTRRQLARLALATTQAAALLPLRPFAAAHRQGRPDSRVRGVMIGMNVPYNFGGRTTSVDEIIENCVKLGISGLELRTQPVEALLGLPANVASGAAGGGRRGAPPPTPEQEAARKAAAEELRKWRLALPMHRVKDVRARFEDAGLLIEIVKVDGIFGMPDEVIDYKFQLARTLGARAISTEISVPDTKRVGQFADRHKMMVGYHGHASTSPADWETAFSHAAHNGANLDIGHFVAGNHGSPIPFLQQHHSRITHIHVKDRKADNGPNVPFGQGDTPIRDVLRLIRDERWNIQATIEFEYPIPDGSDRMSELARCVEYCRTALDG
jgi:sugar phosphate isomerase/epimerase